MVNGMVVSMREPTLAITMRIILNDKRETEEERKRDQAESQECCNSSTLPFNNRGSTTTLNWYHMGISPFSWDLISRTTVSWPHPPQDPDPRSDHFLLC